MRTSSFTSGARSCRVFRSVRGIHKIVFGARRSEGAGAKGVSVERVKNLHFMVLAALLVLLSACATGLRLDELPDAPLVFVHLTEEEARENRAVNKAQRDAGYGFQSTDSKNRIVPNSAELKAMFGVVEVGKQATPGRVVQFFPRTGELRPIDAVLRGGWPHAWNGKRTHLLFSYRPDFESRSQLFAFDAARNEVRQLTFGAGFHPFASFCAGERIVVSVGEDAPAANDAAPPYLVKLRELAPDLRFSEPLVSYSVQQQEQLQLWAEANPACAPDGKFVVFEALDVRNPRTSLFIWDATQPATPPRFLARGSDPVFAPNGQWIVYTGPSMDEKPSSKTTETKIWRIRPDGSGRTQIGQGRASEREPTVSPDGKFIVYTVEEEDRLRLYIKRFDGSGERVLFSDGDGWLPVW